MNAQVMYCTSLPHTIRSLREMQFVYAWVICILPAQSWINFKHVTFKFKHERCLCPGLCLTSATAEILTHLLHDATWNKTMWWLLAILYSDRFHFLFLSWDRQNNQKGLSAVCWLNMLNDCPWERFVKRIWREQTQIFRDWDGISYPSYKETTNSSNHQLQLTPLHQVRNLMNSALMPFTCLK